MNKKNWLANSLLFIFSILFSLLLVEILFRFYLFGWDSFSIEKVNSVHPLGVSGLVQPSPYSELIYELKPNLKSYFKMTTFETNSQGLRDKEYSIVRPKNTIRVAVIGDSFTMSSGVNIEDAYHTLLEDKFNQEQKGTHFEFINFGVGGYSLRQYLGVLQYKALKYDPQLIVIGFCSNDFVVLPNELFQTQYRPKNKTYPFFKSFAIEQLIGQLKRVTKGLGGKPLKNNDGKEIIKQEQYLKTIFSKIETLAKEKNIPVLVAYLWHFPPAPREPLVKRIVTESGFHFIDVSSSFRGTNASDYKIYAIDIHPNDKANKIFADTIYNYLKFKMDFPN